MSANTNNNNTFENITDGLTSAAQNLGLVMMATATTLGLVETGDHQITKAALSVQPVFAVAQIGPEGNSPFRRERTEETGPHYISYSVGQRTPGRTGKI
ncbi:MAG: hypothetical protein JWO41_853 [Candidatus Saccharibacteria bacterium]|nr:hypothetical protein [Candidatus Saccharibacteria bacterium]